MDKEYIVKDGDTIYSISLMFNTTPEILDILNNGSLSILPGNKIRVPSLNNNFFDYYVITNGDTLNEIASKNGINPSLLAKLNGINIDDYIYPNQVLLVPKAGSIMYISGIGDTLQEIAKKLNTSIDEIVRENQNIYLQPEQLIVYKLNK